MYIWEYIRENILTLDLLYTVPAILIAMTFHEVSHGFAAYLLGDTTAKTQGRLSLNPVRHIDIFGLLLLIVAGFGWAKPVGVDMSNFKNPKKDMALTAAAGPVSNFIMAFLSMTIVVILRACGIGPVSVYFYQFFLILAAINVSLGIFNLIPIPPLDGSKVVASILPDRIYINFLRFERYGFLALILLLNFGPLRDMLVFARDSAMQAVYLIARLPVDAVAFLLGTRS